MGAYFNIGLIYLLIGFAVALIAFFLLRYQVLGKFWGALIVAILGACLGGVISYFFKDVIQYLSDFNNVNIFPPIITAFLLLWLFAKVSD